VHGEAGSPVTVALTRDEAWVSLSVSSVSQVSRHVRERLFRRFVTTRADKGGTGLGLAIVRAVAEAHGGHVELAHAGPPRAVFRMTVPGAWRSTASQLRDAVQEARQEFSVTPDLDQ
jgi:two-component system sensor histidine kinase CreC